MEKIKWLVACILGLLSAFAKQYGLIITFVGCAVVFDWITGIVGAKAMGEKITSKKGWTGFWKKIALFCGLFFGFFLDYFIPYFLGALNITLPIQTAVFGLIIGCYIVINECISICENIYKANPAILPQWVVKILQLAKVQIDSLDKEDENNESINN